MIHPAELSSPSHSPHIGLSCAHSIDFAYLPAFLLDLVTTTHIALSSYGVATAVTFIASVANITVVRIGLLRLRSTGH